MARILLDIDNTLTTPDVVINTMADMFGKEYITSDKLKSYTMGKTFDYTNKLKEIDVPVLITSGADDLSTPVVSKTMYDHIKNAKWELFANSRHMPFVDEKRAYKKILRDWLASHD